jgi:hypothetical protein
MLKRWAKDNPHSKAQAKKAQLEALQNEMEKADILQSLLTQRAIHPQRIHSGPSGRRNDLAAQVQEHLAEGWQPKHHLPPQPSQSQKLGQPNLRAYNS